MRISTETIKQATDIIARQYGDHAKIWLFGSRVDDKQRGGDVYIFVETESSDIMRKIHCKNLLVDLFDLKVDLVVGKGDKPIHRIAKSTGVRLR